MNLENSLTIKVILNAHSFLAYQDNVEGAYHAIVQCWCPL